MSDEKLTPEQIQNWRKVLCGMVGAYALIMPDSEVQAFRDKLQGDLTPRAGDLASRPIQRCLAIKRQAPNASRWKDSCMTAIHDLESKPPTYVSSCILFVATYGDLAALEMAEQAALEYLASLPTPYAPRPETGAAKSDSESTSAVSGG